jgi:hypothetical protein
VVLGEVLEEQAPTAQRMHVHQVCAIDDGGEHLAEVIDAMRLLDEAALAEEVVAVRVERVHSPERPPGGGPHPARRSVWADERRVAARLATRTR